MKGRSFMIRFADDYIAGFELESDANRVLASMVRRFDRFGLELHPDKTKLVRFGQPGNKNGRIDKPGTFDFLGFTFYRGISRQGYWVIKKKTARKRLNRFKKKVWEWCKKNRHKSLKWQYATLCSKLRGYYQYFGVICNFKAIKRAQFYTLRAWRYWLCRRSHKGKVSYEDLTVQYPLPKPRIIHDI